MLRLEDLPANTQAELLAGSRTRKKSKAKQVAERFEYQLRQHRLHGWIREHRFAREELGRDWRFDFANIELRLALEIEGLVVRKLAGQTVVQGRHATITGFKDDCIKYAAAVELGWFVLRFEQSQVMNGTAIAAVERVLARRGVSRGAIAP